MFCFVFHFLGPKKQVHSLSCISGGNCEISLFGDISNILIIFFFLDPENRPKRKKDQRQSVRHNLFGMRHLALHGHMKPITMVKYNRDGDFVFSTALESTVMMWSTQTGESFGSFEGHKSVAGCDVNWCTTLLATAGMDSMTKLWRVDSGECLATIDHVSPCRCVAFAHDDSHIFTVTGGRLGEKPTLSFFNLPNTVANGEVCKTQFNPCSIFTSPTIITFATWGPTNDNVYLTYDDGSVSIFDVERMEEVRNVQVHDQVAKKVHFDSNYYTLVTASDDKTAKLLDSRNLNVIQTFTTDQPVNDASISPTGDHVIVGGGTPAQDVTTTGGQGKFEVKFFHKVRGEQLGSVKCHFGTINAVSFHPSGRSFASGAVDGFVKLMTFDEKYYSAPGSKPLWDPATATE